jgi:signal transduction histidine kinase
MSASAEPRIAATPEAGAVGSGLKRAGVHRATASNGSASNSIEALLDIGSRWWVERLLAAARLVLAIALFVVMLAGSGLLHTRLASLLMAAYSVYAAFALWWVWRNPSRAARATRTIQLADLAWATVATSVSGGTASNAYPLFVFVVLGAAYRWGLRRSVIDGAVIFLISSAQSLLAVAGFTPWPFELDLYVLRVSYTLLFSLMFGLLSEEQHSLTFQSVTIGQLMTRVGHAKALSRALHDLLEHALALFGARRGLLASQDVDGGAAVLWDATLEPNGRVAVRRAELAPRESDAFFFPVPLDVHTWEVHRRAGRWPWASATALDNEGATVEPPSWVPDKLLTDWSWGALTVTSVDLPDCWKGRLFLLDAARPLGARRRLRFLKSLVHQVTPALANLYLLRRVRSRVEDRERARLSRELHDGVIQSLAALQVRIEVVRRRVETLDTGLSRELAEVRDVLHDETLGARELMQRLSLVETRGQHLPIQLRALADRFSQPSGIAVDVAWMAGTPDLTPRQGREVLRIVQEALVNVRRHSGATKVEVRVAADAWGWELTIQDNGHGFGFTGRVTHEELLARDEGPRVIRERVQALDGFLVVHSSEQGARLEIAFPRAHLSD